MRHLLLPLSIIPLSLSQGTLLTCFKPHAHHDTKQIKCLSVMIYGEARGESTQGQVAVAYTALNRAAKGQICKTVLAPKQYSIFNNNPALKAAALSATLEPEQKTAIDKESWVKAVKIARSVVNKEVADPTSGATHYVAFKSLKHIPKWTYSFKKVYIMDNHTFFKDGTRIS